ncbi:LysR family transcriptional regulator [Ramlibacter sp. 2FC]|uniref:LysR family transcriptional regulator n=1 Tax=Ramlibacter sp. 2FC TaxID=2502188 RepID=UPI00148537B8|nr:LysR family transcriptional regulator [Ramlibacter sp. 2FC]
MEQLEVFAAAARERSFSATARKLGKSQSAISTAIAELEIDLGVELFDRGARYPVLTHAGTALLAEVDAILSHRDTLLDRANALTGLCEPRVAIAMEDACPYGVIAPTLSRFAARFPMVQVEILQPLSTPLAEMILAGEAALGLGCPQPDYPAGIGFRRLGEVTLVNVVRADHPLGAIASVSFAHLADHMKLSMAAQSRRVTTSEYLKSPRQWLVHSELALLELLKGGLGWAAVPRRLVADELASGELVELRLEAYPFTQWTVGLDLVWQVDTKPGVAGTWLRVELGNTKVFG